MSLVLSSEDQTLFTGTLQTLLSPLAFPDANTWRSEAARAVKTLLRGDTTSIILPAEGIFPYFSDDMPGYVLDEYVNYYHTVDVGVSMAEELRMDVYGSRVMPPEHWRRYRRSEVCNDYYRRYGMTSAVGMIARLPEPAQGSSRGELRPKVPNVAAISVHSPRESHEYLCERGVAIARMLLPAFRCGVESLISTRVTARALSEQVDHLSVGALVYDLDGTTLHRNPALIALLQADPRRAVLEQAGGEIRQALLSLFAATRSPAFDRQIRPPEREVRTAAGTYRLRGSFLGEGEGVRIPLLLVTVERRSASPPRMEELQTRFGLTRQESRVATLLAQRRRNDEVAAALGVSVHTARHHTESVLAKLGVHSRDEVAGRIA